MERLIDTGKLEAVLREFTLKRDWSKYHTPKNLIMALTGEVGELAEIFQWLTEEESKLAAIKSETARPVRDEIADIFIYTVQLAISLGVDLNEAVANKLASNKKKYPEGDSTPKR